MPTKTQTDAELHFFIDADRAGAPPDYLRSGVASILINIAAFTLFGWLWTKEGTRPSPPNELRAELRKATRLVDPLVHISQPSTVHSGATKQVRLQDLTERARQSPPPAPKRFQAPPMPKSPKPGPAPLTPPPAPPNLEATNRNVTPPPGVNAPLPPPRIQTEEPKLAFETPGAPGTAPRTNTTLARILPPSHSLDDAVHSAARSANQGGADIGEMEVKIAPPQIPGMGVSPERLKSTIAPQILSDTHGVDFRPYLIRVLTAVRRNWAAVVPESARLGRQGVVTLQFAIARDGSVPRLVISIASGTDALDRAAVAGVSASNPFPPLPAEYTGSDLRLQLVFTYNMPRR